MSIPVIILSSILLSIMLHILLTIMASIRLCVILRMLVSVISQSFSIGLAVFEQPLGSILVVC